MFNKSEFSHTLSRINDTYNTMTDFAKKASFDRTYISKYINLKLNNPPTPKILNKIANASNGITTYEELMNICGYLTSSQHKNDNLILNFYEELTQLEDEYNKYMRHIHFTNEEDSAFDVLYEQILPHIGKLTPVEQMNFEDYVKDLDFLSKKSLKKLKDALIVTYEYFSEKRRINHYIEDLKENTNTSPNINLTKFNKDFLYKYYMCPVYGRISAGIPNWAEECIEGRLPIDYELMNIANPEECFFLRVNGESMNKEIKNGAYALIRKQDTVENGEIAVVLINGYDATLKKFSKQGDLVILEPMSNDPNFTTQVYNKDTEIKIIGKYIGKMEMK